MSSTNHESPPHAFSPQSPYLIPLRPKYVSQHAVIHDLSGIINFEYCSVHGVMASVWFDALFALCMTNLVCSWLPIVMVDNAPYQPVFNSARTNYISTSSPRLVPLASFITGPYTKSVSS